MTHRSESMAAPQRSDAQLRASRRILVVEDEALIAHDLACTLRDLGYAVAGIASTSAMALRLAEEQRPDLVLMDIRLPKGPDGIRTAAMIRERQPIPIVYLTSNTDPATLQRALATAPGGYLAKPFDSRSVLTTIEVALRRHQEESVLTAARDTSADQAMALRSEVRELSGLVGRLQHDSTTDALTGLCNRRSFDEALSEAVAHVLHRGGSLGVILFDLDRFKQINDVYGHQVGDAALKGIGELLRTELREQSDSAYRYGGEEFVVLARGAELAGAWGIAERLRQAIAHLTVLCGGVCLPSVTASFGVSAFPEHSEVELLGQADAALYRAKRGGRNLVVAANTPTAASRETAAKGGS